LAERKLINCTMIFSREEPFPGAPDPTPGVLLNSPLKKSILLRRPSLPLLGRRTLFFVDS
jgi:hypothetical protein